MKIAAVSDDGEKISAHFGRAAMYVVVTVESGQMIDHERRAKANPHASKNEASHDHHHHNQQGRGFGQHSAEKHQRMMAAIPDCQIVLARGMGQGAYNMLQEAGICPIVTDISDVETAVQAVIDGSIVDHRERLH